MECREHRMVDRYTHDESVSARHSRRELRQRLALDSKDERLLHKLPHSAPPDLCGGEPHAR